MCSTQVQGHHSATSTLDTLPEAMSAFMFLTADEHLVLFPSCSQSFIISDLLKCWAGSPIIEKALMTFTIKFQNYRKHGSVLYMVAPIHIGKAWLAFLIM